MILPAVGQQKVMNLCEKYLCTKDHYSLLRNIRILHVHITCQPDHLHHRYLLNSCGLQLYSKQVVGTKIAVFWVVALCSLVEIYQHFLEMVNFYETTKCYKPEDNYLSFIIIHIWLYPLSLSELEFCAIFIHCSIFIMKPLN